MNKTTQETAFGCGASPQIEKQDNQNLFANTPGREAAALRPAAQQTRVIFSKDSLLKLLHSASLHSAIFSVQTALFAPH
jgi:hypothetical protein